MTARLFTVTFMLFLTTAIRSAGQEIVHLGVDKGLSNGYVTAIAEDGNNNIWVATEEGLNRWDGKRFHKYMPGNSALTDPELSSLICLEDDKDHVWVGSQRNGIFCVDLQGYKISKVDRGFRTRDIAALTPGRNGGMWITHYHFGPQFYDPVRDVLHPSVSGRTPGLPTLSWTTYEAADGRLYIGHVDQGLSVVDTLTHTFRNYRYPELPGNTVYAITGDELGNIWIGTDHGAAFFNPTTGEIKKIEHDHCNPASIRPGNVRSIVAGDNGTLWFATSQGGVSVLNIKEVMTNGIDSARFTSLPYNNAPGGTAGSFIRCILRDSYGNMWIGNYNRGVDFHSHKPSIITRVNYFKENRRERYLPVMSASATRDGSVWIGSDPDMALISPKGEVLRRVPLTYDGKRLTSYVRCVYADEEYGRVWAGTNEEGLYIYRPADGSVAKADMPLTNMRSVKVFGDSVYVSTDVGVYSISRQGTQAVPCTAFNDSLEDKIVNDFEIDRRGLYWVATFGKGLYVFGPDRRPIAHFSDASGFPSNRVNAIVHDSRGNTWAATMRGLVRFNSNDINDYHKVESIDRLDISHINSVCEGAGGRIWFATNNSLGYVNPADEEASLFLSNDATPMHSFIAGVSYADNDGVISFPSINGLIRVNSRAVDSFDEPLDVHVTSFVSFSEDSSAKGLEQMLGDGTVRLRHDENDFTVTFSIPDYAHMLYADFSYRLDGFDDIWHEIMGDNTVSFHSIQPGEYKLQVRRRSDGDSWSLPQQVLTVIIEPSPWLTWWAKLIYVLLALAFCAVVAYLLKHRIDARRLYLQEKEHSRNAQELNEERLRFYTNVTHELRTPLTLIMGPLEDLVSDPSLPSKYAYKLRMMRSNAESLLTLINGILEFRKTETLNRQLTVRRGPVANLVREIGLRFKESTQNQKLRFVFDIEDNSPEIYYDNDIVTIVLNNLLSNAVKYTPEGEIRLSLHTVSDDKGVRRTVIAVSDTGYGISGKALNLIFQRYFQANGEHQASGTGIGLALVKNLADLHHATIEVQSVEGKGSTFSLSLLTDESYPEALHFDEPQAGVEDRGAGYEVADGIQCVDGQGNTPPNDAASLSWKTMPIFANISVSHCRKKPRYRPP